MTSKLILRYLSTNATKEEEDDVIANFQKLLQSSNLSLIDIVTGLGEYLTDPDATVRSRSTRLLSSVIAALDASFLSKQQVEVMTRFFCDRLDDDVCLTESINALTSLAMSNSFTKELTHEVTKAIFSLDTQPQKLPHRVRFLLYTLIDSLMTKQRAALKSLGSQFLEGYINLLTGEKDPRNLMLAFSTMSIILKEFDILTSVSELFDVLYCYFPITFRPSADEPMAITTDDLKTRLRSCLCATHQFAPYLMPALLEKLNAVAMSVKKDTLLTIKECTHTYSSRVLDVYNVQLWDSIKYEIIQSEDNILEEVALDVLNAITECHARGLQDLPKQGPLARWLQQIVREGLQQLKEPELKSARPCGKILKAVSTASPICLRVVLETILPPLLALCNEATGVNRISSLIDVLKRLVEAFSQAPLESVTLLTSLGESSRAEVVDVLIATLLNAPKVELDLRRLTLQTLMTATSVVGFLDGIALQKVVVYLTQVTVDESDSFHEEAVSSLVVLSDQHADLILEFAFPILLSRLPDSGIDKAGIQPRRTLSILARLSVTPNVSKTFLIRIFSRIDACLVSIKDNQAYITALLGALLQVVRQLYETHPKALEQMHDKVVPPLFDRVIAHASDPLLVPENLSCISAAINFSTRVLSKDRQRERVNSMFAFFLKDKVIDDRHPAVLDEGKFRPDLLGLFTATYAAVEPNLGLPIESNSTFLRRIIEDVSDASRPAHRLALLRMIALVVNKDMTDAEVSIEADFIMTRHANKALDQDVLLWFTKGLLLRGHSSLATLVRQILEADRSNDDLICVAANIAILLEDDFYLTRENRAIVKKLHKQKFYAIAMPTLLKDIQQTRKYLANVRN